jgi:large subunit ribosomal protein L19
MSQHPVIRDIEATYRRNLPAFRSGDTVRVHTLIKEGDKERVQVFEGVVIDRRRGGARASFTVRKISYGVGVERIFPLHTSRTEKIEVVQKGHVRRARLNYLRELQGRAARIKHERAVEVVAETEEEEAPEPVAPPPAQPAPEAKSESP